MPRRAVPLRTRAWATLLALLPGAGLIAWNRDGRFLGWLAAALLLSTLLAHLRRNPARQQDPSRLARVLLIALWLPSTTSWLLPAALLAALALEGLFDGRDAANPFQPSMVASAIAMTLFPATPPSTLGTPPMAWICMAWIAGGLALMAARCIRWQAPLAMLAGAMSVLAIWNLVSPQPVLDPALRACLPSFVLTAFFVIDDPPRACMHPTARWACGFAAGLAAAVAMLAAHACHADARMLPALAGTVLAMNAAAPWLDRQLAPKRAPMLAVP